MQSLDLHHNKARELGPIISTTQIKVLQGFCSLVDSSVDHSAGRPQPSGFRLLRLYPPMMENLEMEIAAIQDADFSHVVSVLLQKKKWVQFSVCGTCLTTRSGEALSLLRCGVRATLPSWIKEWLGTTNKKASLPLKAKQWKHWKYFSPSILLLSVVAAISCGTPHSVGNGSFRTNQYTVGSQVTYHCDQGYHLDPGVPTTAVCLEDGSWSNAASTPRCLCQYSSGRHCLLLNSSVAVLSLNWLKATIRTAKPRERWVSSFGVMHDTGLQREQLFLRTKLLIFKTFGVL